MLKLDLLRILSSSTYRRQRMNLNVVGFDAHWVDKVLAEVVHVHLVLHEVDVELGVLPELHRGQQPHERHNVV